MDNPVIILGDASLTLGNRRLWNHMDVRVAPGEFIAVLGPNGAGKSSLLKVVTGEYALSEGEVSVLGTQPARARKNIGYIPQQKAFDRTIPISGRGLVRLGINGARWFARPASRADESCVAQAIAEVGATAYADKPLGLLSGGEQQRLRIAQALVGSPKILLCDEPLLSLDVASQQSISTLISQQRNKGTAVLFVTHEINPVLPYVDRILYLASGNWTIGAPDEILTSDHLTKLYGVPVDVLRVHGRVIVVSAADQAITEPTSAHHHGGQS